MSPQAWFCTGQTLWEGVPILKMKAQQARNKHETKRKLLSEIYALTIFIYKQFKQLYKQVTRNMYIQTSETTIQTILTVYYNTKTMNLKQSRYFQKN